MNEMSQYLEIKRKTDVLLGTDRTTQHDAHHNVETPATVFY